uniref:Ig-like domain-containing protein n=1 Tax=Macrostomum lignano TaxID=282301 RepID=A0A1I8HHZ0_9PLAT
IECRIGDRLVADLEVGAQQASVRRIDLLFQSESVSVQVSALYNVQDGLDHRLEQRRLLAGRQGLGLQDSPHGTKGSPGLRLSVEGRPAFAQDGSRGSGVVSEVGQLVVTVPPSDSILRILGLSAAPQAGVNGDVAADPVPAACWLRAASRLEAAQPERGAARPAVVDRVHVAHLGGVHHVGHDHQTALRLAQASARPPEIGVKVQLVLHSAQVVSVARRTQRARLESRLLLHKHAASPGAAAVPHRLAALVEHEQLTRTVSQAERLTAPEFCMATLWRRFSSCCCHWVLRTAVSSTNDGFLRCADASVAATVGQGGIERRTGCQHANLFRTSCCSLCRARSGGVRPKPVDTWTASYVRDARAPRHCQRGGLRHQVQPVASVKSAVTLSTRTSSEGAHINITCSFDGPPPFGATTVPSLVRFQSPTPFMALEESDLDDSTQSPTSQPRQIIDNTNWRLNKPWADFPARYSPIVRHNDTSVTFQIVGAIAQDTGYYGCQFNSDYSAFKPLLVYAKNISVNASVLIGSQTNVSKIGNELEVTFNGINSQYVELAVRLISNYANLSFTAQLFSNRSLQSYSVVSPNADKVSCQQEVFCLWNVQLYKQVVLSNAPRLHADQLSLQFAHPTNPDRVLWSAQARLLDDRQPRDIVTNSSVVCNQPGSQIRVKHGQPVEVACSVPRLWLSLPGFTAYWTVSSSVQFYPVGSVSCAYPMDSVRLLLNNMNADNQWNWPDKMLDPPSVPAQSACINNRFRTLLEADFGWRLVIKNSRSVAANPAKDDVLTSGANSVSSADNRAAISAAVLVASALSFLLPAC